MLQEIAGMELGNLHKSSRLERFLISSSFRVSTTIRFCLVLNMYLNIYLFFFFLCNLDDNAQVYFCDPPVVNSVLYTHCILQSSQGSSVAGVSWLNKFCNGYRE